MNLNENIKIPTLLKVKRALEIDFDNTANFETIDGNTEKLDYITIPDISYNLTLKIMFCNDSLQKHGMKGEDRLKNFIHSLLFQGLCEEGIITEIENIEYLELEKVNYDEEYRKGPLYTNISCKCKCNQMKNNEVIKTFFIGFDIQMQIKYYFINESEYDYSSIYDNRKDVYFVFSLLDFDEETYNSNLYKENKHHDNSESDNNNKNICFKRWFALNLEKFNENSSENDINHDLFYKSKYYVFKEKIEDIFSNKKIKFNFNINDLTCDAKAWLKLLCLRMWSIKDCYNFQVRYIIPKDFEGLNPEIKEGIRLLRKITKQEFFAIYDEQEYELNLVQQAKIKGIKDRMKERKKFAEKTVDLKYLLTDLISGEFTEWLRHKVYYTYTDEELEIVKRFLNDKNYKIKKLAEELKLNEVDVLKACESNNLATDERKTKRNGENDLVFNKKKSKK